MKKIYIFLISIVALFVMGIVAFNFLLFEESSEFYDFPVPKSAEILKKEDTVMTFKYSGVSQDEGISMLYELYLQKEGWKEKLKEGSSVIYIKDGKEIDLISFTKEITIIKR